MRYRSILAIASILFMCACSAEVEKDSLTEAYIQDFEEWTQNRDERLRNPNGWVNLAGLYWFDSDTVSFGSSPENDLIFPKGSPETMGKFAVVDSTVTLYAEAEIYVQSEAVDEAVVYAKRDQVQHEMVWNSLRWYVIERAGNLGVRLRDVEHPAMKEPLNIPHYELSEKWIVEATFEEFDTPRTRMIKNIIGHEFEEEFLGEYVFEMDGETYRLLPSLGETSSFIMFGDESNGLETYGGGRYLSADLPDESGKITLDFNRAYNPPCAFTDYATCPLPIADNILNVAVIAGEQAMAVH